VFSPGARSLYPQYPSSIKVGRSRSSSAAPPSRDP